MRITLLSGIITLLLSACNLTKSDRINKLYKETERLGELGDHRGVIEVSNEILKLDPKNMRALVNRGTAKATLGDTTGALADINSSLAIGRSIPALVKKAWLVEPHDPLMALALFHEATTIDSKDEFPYAMLVEYYLEDHPLKDSAIFYANHLKKLGLKTRASLTVLQNTYLAYDDPQQLFEITDRYVKEYPDKSGFVYNNRGYALIRLGHFNEARASIGQALIINPANPYAYRNLGLLFIEKGQQDSVCFYLDKAKENGFTEKYGNEVDSLIRIHCQ